MVILGWNNYSSLRADGFGCLPFIFKKQSSISNNNKNLEVEV
jgi:hypothetical protein